MASRSGEADNAAMFVGYFDVEDSNNVDSCQQEIVTLEPLASTSRQREDVFQCVNIRIHDHDSDRVDDISSQEGLGQKPISSIDKTLDKRTEYVSADKFDAFMERHDNQLSLITASLQSLSEGFSYYEEECDYEEELESNVTSADALKRHADRQVSSVLAFKTPRIYQIDSSIPRSRLHVVVQLRHHVGPTVTVARSHNAVLMTYRM
ncbi:unnamed protein product [Mytilus coruscus]|uniref:Uncharacterized protein n=1 Tax=Mytilus coruscus TaxID=42192 RepID=A0A6J8BFS7_MYTCO|nr:unnamed protein product [Mytilus coruscus]